MTAIILGLLLAAAAKAYCLYSHPEWSAVASATHLLPVQLFALGLVVAGFGWAQRKSG